MSDKIVYFKDLKKKEKAHLKEIGCKTLADFKRNAELHVIMRAENKERGFHNIEPCYECKHIAIKLGLPV